MAYCVLAIALALAFVTVVQVGRNWSLSAGFVNDSGLSMLQGPELLLIILIVVVIFGVGKLPKISQGLARLRLNFEKGVAEDYIEVGSESDEQVDEEIVGDKKDLS